MGAKRLIRTSSIIAVAIQHVKALLRHTALDPGYSYSEITLLAEAPANELLFPLTEIALGGVPLKSGRRASSAESARRPGGDTSAMSTVRQQGRESATYRARWSDCED
jgi:hypothetical protein